MFAKICFVTAENAPSKVWVAFLPTQDFSCGQIHRYVDESTLHEHVVGVCMKHLKGLNTHKTNDVQIFWLSGGCRTDHSALMDTSGGGGVRIVVVRRDEQPRAPPAGPEAGVSGDVRMEFQDEEPFWAHSQVISVKTFQSPMDSYVVGF